MEMNCKVESGMLEAFKESMIADEKEDATIEKYLRDVRWFMKYAGEGSEITKELLVRYKKKLMECYSVASVNSMIAALNCFLRFIGRPDYSVRAVRLQRENFRTGGKELSMEEYQRLLAAAEAKGKRRLYLLMKTIAATGIRISELPFITVEALQTRRAVVSLKGKTRTVILTRKLCEELKSYARGQGIETSSIFITRSGRPINRSNVLREMKALCADAHVDKEKIFPHNLRHLFAVTYYETDHDLCHLADLLGHSNLNTTRIYTQISADEQERRLDKLDQIYYEKSTT